MYLHFVVLLGIYIFTWSGSYSSDVSFCLLSVIVVFIPQTAGLWKWKWSSHHQLVFLLLLSDPWWMRPKRLVQTSCERDWFLPTYGWTWFLTISGAGLCQGVCLVGSCGLRKTLGSLCADWWGCVPALLVWLQVSQRWSLQAVGSGPDLGEKIAPSKRLPPMSTPQNYCHQCFCPCSEPYPSPASAREWFQQIGLAQAFMRSLFVCLFFTLVVVYRRPCVHSPRVEFLFPPVLWISCNQTLLAELKASLFWGLFLIPDLQAGEPDMGLRTFTPVGEPQEYNYFPVCELPI